MNCERGKLGNRKKRGMVEKNENGRRGTRVDSIQYCIDTHPHNLV